MKKSDQLTIGTVRVAQLLSGAWVASYWGGTRSGWMRLSAHYGSREQAIEAARIAADNYAPRWEQVMS